MTSLSGALRRLLSASLLIASFWGTAAAHSQVSPAQVRTLVVGEHMELVLDGDLVRLAVGATEVVRVEPLSARELLVVGLAPGRSGLSVWLEGDRRARFELRVEPDLSVLREALAELDGEIRVELAPDRAVVLLRGSVENLAAFRDAESLARAYLDARTPGLPALAADGEGGSVLLAGQTAPGRGAVLNLLRIRQAPMSLEERLAEAIRAAGARDVRVRRIPTGDVQDDNRDPFVLEGTVPDQVALVRALRLAASALLGPEGARAELNVVADEAGALRDKLPGGTGGGLIQLASATSLASGTGTGGARRLDNRVEANLARASLVEAAGGRILSFLRVQDLPQVRIDVRLVEVNRSELLQRRSELGAIFSDFDQGGMVGSGLADTFLASSPAVGSVSPVDAQGGLSFLENVLGGQVQVAGSRFAVDAALGLLETHGLARSLSRPSLTVLSGELARFQVGGEIPILSSFQSGTGGVAGVFNAVDFVSFGVQLTVRPLVGEDGAITLDVQPQVVQPDSALTTSLGEDLGSGLPSTAFASRALRTSARVNDGETLLIGGLLSSSTRGSDRGAPGLKDLPLIGLLFQDARTQTDETELLIAINPTLVRAPRATPRLWAFSDPLEALFRR